MNIMHKKAIPWKIPSGVLLVSLILIVSACGGGGGGGAGDSESIDINGSDALLSSGAIPFDDDSASDTDDLSILDDGIDSSDSISIDSGTVNSVNDDNETGTGNSSNASSSTGCGAPTGFSKKVEVLGLCVFSTATVADSRILHAARVLAEYLDNDENGVADNATLIAKLLERKAYMVMFLDQSEQDSFAGELTGNSQNLFDHETHPEGSSEGDFDATLEEVLHLISHEGLANIYPDVFGENSGTSLTDAMDTARGGHFEEIPSTYPSSAWFTYNDSTCDYACQATEYFYFALTSILGAQEYAGRYDNISIEWKLNTRSKVQAGDPTIYSLLTDNRYQLPTVVPDGKYNGATLTIEAP
ncbi:MAG: hypothetical protein HQM13_10840 [SAR324 cluster bacterium]|nr:hypothetical protein [SAR324 cluster bacterium]